MSLRPSKRRRVSPPGEDNSALVARANDDSSPDSDGSEEEIAGQIMNGDGVSSEEDEDDDEVDGVDGLEDEDDVSESDENEDEDEDEEDDNEDDGDDTQRKTSVATSARAQVQPSKQQSHPKQAPVALAGPGANVLKLQVEEMLKSARPVYGAQEKPAEEMLRRLKTIIETIPDRDPLPIEQAEKDMLKQKVVIPFPQPRPPQNAQYKLGFAKPSSINLMGSYALKTATRIDGNMDLDLVVTMPTSLFTEKDYLDYRYFHKRAYYLASIAAALQKSKDLPAVISFTLLGGNDLQPILLVKPKPDTDLAKSNCTIRILLAMQQAFFPLARTLPTKCCVRMNSSSGVSADTVKTAPTPFYNSSLRADSAYTAYLKLIHGANTNCAGYRDACLLGKIWMRQRGISGSVHQGGFGHFEWAALVALLLQGGGAKGKPVLLSTYDGYQIFRATLVFLAGRDLVRQPLVFGEEDVGLLKMPGQPMIFDAARGVNILYKMTSSSYHSLRKQVQTTIKMLSGNNDNQFENTFTVQVAEPLMQYDLIGQLVLGENGLGSATKKRKTDHPGLSQHVHDLLNQALGNRVSMIHVRSAEKPSWSTDTSKPRQVQSQVSFGLLLDPNNASRTVERGPPAEETQAGAAFREFWGDKAELRRFKDGSIVESLVWKTSHIIDLTKEIVTYILGRHLSTTPTFYGNSLASVPNASDLFSSTTSFDHMREAYRTLENDVRSLEGLPLSIRQFQASSPLLRSTSLRLPLDSPSSSSEPASVLLQFEGSGRWPDDLHAIQMTKLAFLLRIEHLLTTAHPHLTTRIGLENDSASPNTSSAPNTTGTESILNRSFLDITYPPSPTTPASTPTTFRLRIHHDRESALLARLLASKAPLPTTTATTREAAAQALATYKRDFLAAPLHTQTLQTLTTRFPALGPTCRMLKAWFAAHLLSPHFPDELIELFALRAFLQPAPWQAPSSPQTGFLRTLLFLARWDWRSSPLILDVSASDAGLVGNVIPGEESMKFDEQAAWTRFEAWRKLDPGCNRVVLFVATNYAREGTTWTERGVGPEKVVVGRMGALARAAVEMVRTKGLELDVGSLFKSPLKDFDFVVHIAPKFRIGGGGHKRREGQSKFKNLQVVKSVEPELIGYDPVRLYFEELKRVYGDSVVFFADEGSWEVIAGLWSPHTARRKFKVNLGYSSIPTSGMAKKVDDEEVEQEEVEVDVNKDGILNEMARLGGDIVSKIERNR